MGRSYLPRRVAACTAVGAALLAAGAAPASADVSASVIRNSLRISSDGASDQIEIKLNFIDLDSVVVQTPTDFVGNFDRDDFTNIIVDAGAGDDRVTLSGSEVFTPTDPVTVTGGAGRDILVGGNGRETMFGGDDVDRIDGGGGTDLLVGDAGEDEIEGGAGPDTVSGGGDADTFEWAAGDGSDTVVGGPDPDTLSITAEAGPDRFLVEDTAGSLRVIHNIDQAAVGIQTLERLDIETRGGDDIVATGGALPASLDFEVLGESGSDQISGGAGADEIDGGSGADRIRGLAGSDAVEGGAGDDVVQGDAGDDAIAGDAGDDTLSGDEGADFLRGGDGGDRFECDGRDTVFDLTALDATGGTCLAPAPEPGTQPQLPPEPVVPPSSRGGDPAAPGAALPRGFLGFARPKVTITRTGLKAVVRNTHSGPVTVVIAASERRGRRKHNYKRARRTIRPGRSAAVVLKAPRAHLRARGKRRAAVTVTNRETGGKLVARR